MDAITNLPFVETLAFPAVATTIAIFTRLSALYFFLPGIGERAVPVRVRLVTAFAVALVLFPAIGVNIPETLTVSAAAKMIAAEAVAGALIGFSIRIAIFILQMTGAMASQSFSLAQIFGPSISDQPESPLASILMMAGIVLFLSSGLHFELINALVLTYNFMPLGAFPGASATGDWAADRMAFSFAAALSLAMPFIVLGFIYNLAIGAANRAMPQLMVAFVGIPAVTLAGLILLALSAPILMNSWMNLVGEIIRAFMERL